MVFDNGIGALGDVTKLAAHETLEVGKALVYAALQKPVTSLSQWADAIVGTDLEHKTAFIEKPNAAFGTVDWHADQIGSGIGGFIPYAAVLIATRPLGKRFGEFLLSKDLVTVKGAMQIKKWGTIAAAGFLNGAILDPNEQKGHFVGERIIHGAVGTASMLTLHASSSWMTNEVAALSANILAKSAKAGLAGSAAGFVSAEVSSVLNEHRFASGREIAQSMYSTAFTGASMGLVGDSHFNLSPKKVTYGKIEEFVAKNDDLGTEHNYYYRLHSKSVAGKAETIVRNTLDAAVYHAKGTFQSIISRDASDSNQSQKPIPQPQRWFREPDATFHERSRLNHYSPLDRVEIVSEIKRAVPSILASEPNLFHFTRVARNASKTSNEPLADGSASKQPIAQSVMESMENGINGFLAGNKLPAVKVQSQWQDDVARYGTWGFLTLGNKSFNDPQVGPEEKASVLFHEVLHSEQNVLRIWLLADEMGIEKTATPKQVEAIAAQLGIGPGSPPKSAKDLVSEILTSRDGRQLEGEVKARAQRMKEGFSDGYLNSPRPLKAEKDGLVRTWNNLIWKYNGINDNNIFDVSKEMVDPKFVRENFGITEIPGELSRLVQHTKVDSEGYPLDWDPKVATNLVNRMLSKRLSELRISVNDVNDRIENSYHHGDAATAKSLLLDAKQAFESDKNDLSTLYHDLNPKTAWTICKDLVDPVLARSRYGFPKVPRRLSRLVSQAGIDADGNPERWDPEIAIGLVHQMINSRSRQLSIDISAVNAQLKDWYYANKTEAEAIPAGALAELAAMAQKKEDDDAAMAIQPFYAGVGASF
jgi:hypothetical protein